MTSTPEQRINRIIKDTIAALPPETVAQRIAYCRANNRHGVDIQFDGDRVILHWAGEMLAEIPHSALIDPDAEPELAGLIDPDDTPDDPSEL